MEVYHTIEAMRSKLKGLRPLGKTIGLVPTMGALHAGHLSLLKASQQDCDLTLATIFVNPTQFNNPEDLKTYPKQLETDIKMLEKAGCDLVFIPEVEEIYAGESILEIKFGELEHIMEGKYRPGHFSGVGLIVAKLLNITSPDIAYFGQKDLQQFNIIKQMVNELFMPVKLKLMPIIREEDGLAMSSRNRKLSEKQRLLAPKIYQALSNAKRMLMAGKDIPDVTEKTKAYFAELSDIRLEYFEVVNLETLKSINMLSQAEPLALCLACYLGDVRLIDNVVIEQ